MRSVNASLATIRIASDLPMIGSHRQPDPMIVEPTTTTPAAAPSSKVEASSLQMDNMIASCEELIEKHFSGPQPMRSKISRTSLRAMKPSPIAVGMGTMGSAEAASSPPKHRPKINHIEQIMQPAPMESTSPDFFWL
eukprot:TRINITY_DN71617_c3_g1_i2.p1 TRINITY_DN71617_c3_g1~~TRINITY_DN71617_c3_g1_i2.p1  ORF type:complete len:148 (-),score=14.17 TRINITY_DN71617_c3_g1_i2:62-472(-)